MNENRVSASISVDIRKHRIRIHKATLNQLGPPKYIQLLVNPDDRIVAVRGLDKKCRESHIVNLTRIRPDNSYELYSKQLVLTLMTLLPELDGECNTCPTLKLLEEGLYARISAIVVGSHPQALSMMSSALTPKSLNNLSSL